MVETECTAAKIAAMMRAIDASKSRNEIDKALENAMQVNNVGRYKAALPLLDAAPVVHARWEKRRNSWYCTNYGAKMDGGEGK